jgi:hypothetical protein
METPGIKLIMLLLLLTFSCHQQVDMEKERLRILESNERQRRAHFEGNAGLLAQEMADTVYTVQRGDIRVETRIDMLARWKDYFEAVQYSKWDDLQPPVIHFSEDATMATLAVKKITVSRLVDNESSPIDTTFFAWTSGYKKVDGEWKIYTIASTRVPR